MKLLSAIVDIVLFGVLAFLSVVLLQSFRYPGVPFSPESVVVFDSLVIVGVVIGLVKYRLWRNPLFWTLFVISSNAIAFFTMTSENGMNYFAAFFFALPVAPVLVVPVWQLIMAMSWAARTLKG